MSSEQHDLDPPTDTVQDGDLTRILHAAADGDQAATEQLVAATYRRLQQIAEQQMRQRHGAHLAGLTLEPQALVHDTLMKLISAPRHYANRRHFYSFASTVMLRVLQDYQRARRAQKRGGHLVRVTLSKMGPVGHDPTAAAEDLPPVLAELEQLDPRKAEVVKLRALWGLEMAEIAEIIEVSIPTVERDWRFARHWVAARLQALDKQVTGSPSANSDLQQP